jgi:hypothetical protein
MTAADIEKAYSKFKDVPDQEEPGKLTESAATSPGDSIEAIYQKHKDVRDSEPFKQQVPTSKYEEGFVYGETPETHFAQRQGVWAEAGNAAGQLIANFVPGVIGNIGAMDPRDWGAGLIEGEKEIGNALTRWSAQAKEKVNTELFPIYQQEPDKTMNLGSTEWWFKNGSSVLGSAAEFAVLGFGIGSVLQKGLSSLKWLRAVDAATKAPGLNTLGQYIAVPTNALALNQAESILEATQVYDQELQKGNAGIEAKLQAGEITSEEAEVLKEGVKLNAASAAGHTVNLNRMNVLLNLTGVAAIMRGSRGSRNIIHALSAPQKMALEGGQEYLEETVNFYAQNRGTEYGTALREGKSYNTGQDHIFGSRGVEKFFEDMTSAKGVEAGFLGAFGGVAQTGLVSGINKLKGTTDTEKLWAENQQNYIKSLEQYRKDNKLSNLKDSGIAAEEFRDLLTTKAKLEEELNADMAAGKPVDNNKIAQLQNLDYALQAQQLFFNFQLGTTEYLEKTYSDIASLSDEDAVKNGFTGIELDPKSPAYYKTKAQTMLSNLKTLEKSYNKVQGLYNSKELFENRANALYTENKLNHFTKVAQERSTEAQKALDRLARKPELRNFSGSLRLNELFDPNYAEQVGDVNNEQLIEARKALVEEARNLPEIQALEKSQELVALTQLELDNLDEAYSKGTSRAEQDRLWKEHQAKKEAEAKLLKQNELNFKKRVEENNAAKKQAEETQKKLSENLQQKHTDQLKKEGVSEQEIADIKAAATRSMNTPVGELPAYTPAEQAAMDKHPKAYKDFLDSLTPPVKVAPGFKPNQWVLTDTDFLEVDKVYENLGKGALDPTTDPVKKVENAKEPNKLDTGHNVMAWLSRAYKKVVDAVTNQIKFADVNNSLNENLKDPSILDARKLKVGDELVVKVDPEGLVEVKDKDGNVILRKWSEISDPSDINAAIAQAPVGIYRKGETTPVGYVHLPSWITSDRVKGDSADIAKEIERVKQIRTEAIQAGPEGVATTVSQRTLGKLFVDADKKFSPVAQNLPDESLEYTVFINGSFLASHKNGGGVNKTVLNQKDLINGMTYVLVPAEQNADPKLTKYWAVPLKMQALTEDAIQSIKTASAIYLRALDGQSTPEDLAIAAEINKMLADAKEEGSRINFDITDLSGEGIRNYTELFIYNHKKERKTDEYGNRISLLSYMNQLSNSLESDYHAHEFSNQGLFFASGKTGVVMKTGPLSGAGLDNYLKLWENHLRKRKHHTSLRFLNNGTVKVPFIKNGQVTEAMPGSNYLQYMKSQGMETRIMGVNIAEEGKPANYVYTIQQIIEFDTKPFNIAPPVPSSAAPEAQLQEGSVTTKTALELQKQNLKSVEEALGDVDFLPAEGLPVKPLLSNELAYQALSGLYTLPPSEVFDNTKLREYLKYVAQQVLAEYVKVQKTKKYLKIDSDETRLAFDHILETIKKFHQERLKSLPATDGKYKASAYVLENFNTFTSLIKYSLQKDYNFRFKKDKDASDYVETAETEDGEQALNYENEVEAQSLKESFAQESLQMDPAKGLTADFRVFLGSIIDPTNPFRTLSTPEKPLYQNFDPNNLYRTLSALLADKAPVFNTMIAELEAWAKKPGFEFLDAVIDKLKNADDRIKSEFVVSMSKHYVNMKHLYIISKASTNNITGAARSYQGVIAEDNANAKAAVIKERWYHDLFYSAVVKEYDGEDLLETRSIYDKAAIQRAVDYFETLLVKDEKTGKLRKPVKAEKAAATVENFNLREWLSLMGVQLSDEALKDLKENGLGFKKKRKKAGNTPYEDLFFSDRGVFYNLNKFLKESILERKGNIFVEETPITGETFMYKLAAFEANFDTKTYSHTHYSGNKNVYSYADNKYFMDRVRALGASGATADLNLLTQLVESEYAGERSWYLRQMLEFDEVTGEFKKDENGNVIYNPDNYFNSNFEVNYTSLSTLIEKGIPTPAKNSLEDLDPREHEIVKWMMFQNRGIHAEDKPRRAHMFHMTLSNKNSMMTMEVPVMKVILNADNTLSDATIQEMFDYTVMPEVNRMRTYVEGAVNIQNYDLGHRLFYHYPELNNQAELFNIDENGLPVLKRDAHIEHRDIFNKVIRETLEKEIAYKLKEWEDLGLIKRDKEGKITHINYMDAGYSTWASKRIKNTKKVEVLDETGAVVESTSSKADPNDLAVFAATEMVTAYMMHNMNLFQLITTDPATQYNTPLDENRKPLKPAIEQVQDTFTNINKRLGGEISPGRDLALENENDNYQLGVIADVKLSSKALKKYEKLFKDNPKAAAYYASINTTDGVEFISLPEKLRFMKESAKLTTEQLDQLGNMLYLYEKQIEAIMEGKDPSKYFFNQAQKDLIFQVDKPIMMGTRLAAGVETKMYVKSAAFHLNPEYVIGTELEKLMLMMYNSNVDRLATASALKLGAPAQIQNVFTEDGNFIEGSELIADQDVFTISRKHLKLQQETPYKEDTIITRVSQASKQAFVNILGVKGFRLPGAEKEFTGKDLEKEYLRYFESLYKTSYDEFSEELGITETAHGDLTIDNKKLNKVLQRELLERGYPIHDLEALGIELGPGGFQFKVPVWALAKSGKLESFLNSLVANRILKQKFNGYGFVLGSEGGFKFNPKTTNVTLNTGKTTEKSVIEGVQALSDATKNQIIFTDKFDTELKSALENPNIGYHQVILPWKYKEDLKDYINEKNQIDTSKLDPEMLKLFGMRIPNQGPNSTAAIEVVGFLPRAAGDVIIAPKEFVVQMGSDFDIDKLYTYMPHYFNRGGKLYKVKHPDENLEADNSKAYAQNMILNIHLAINTNMNPVVQTQIATPLTTMALGDIADDVEELQRKASSKNAAQDNKISIHDLSPASGSFQSYKYQSSVVAGTAIGSFALQNTFNALAQSVDGGLSMVREWSDGESPTTYSFYKFGESEKWDKGRLSYMYSARKRGFISQHISAMLSAALDDEKEQILARIGVNQNNLDVVNFLLQAGFELDTISYFMSQDVIREYTRQLSIHNNNSIKAIAAVMEQEKFKIADEAYLRRGREEGEVSKKTSRKPKKLSAEEFFRNYEYLTPVEVEYEDEVGETNETKRKFWKYYNMSGAELREVIAQGTSYPEYKEVQYALLQKFRDMKSREAASLRHLQGMSNIDSKGIGSNMFQSILQQKQLEDLGNPTSSKIENAGKLFGDFKEIKVEDFDTAEEEALLKAGYKKGKRFYFKGTTIPGFAYAYGVMTNNKIWKDAYPYDHFHVQEAISTIASMMGYQSATLFAAADRDKKIFQHIKSFAYTDSSISLTDPEAVRKAFLNDYDVEEEVTLENKAFAEEAVVLSERLKTAAKSFSRSTKEMLEYSPAEDIEALNSLGVKYQASKEIFTEINKAKVLIKTQNWKELIPVTVALDKAIKEFGEGTRKGVVTTRHYSLGSILYMLKHNKNTAAIIARSPFLNNLYVNKVTDAAKPKVVMFRMPADSVTTNRDIYNDVENLIKAAIPLGTFNGVEYTTRNFIENLFHVANASATSALQQNLLQYMPVKLLIESGYAERLRNYEWSRLLLRDDNALVPRIALQYFQHNPLQTPQTILKNIANVSYGVEELTVEEAKAGFTQADKDKANLTSAIVEFTLNTEGKLPYMTHIKVKDNESILFILQDKETRRYRRVSTLLNSGSSNSHEYNANVYEAKSAYKKNNPSATRIITANPERPNYPPRQPYNAEEATTKEAQLKKDLLNQIGLKYQVYDLSQEELESLLKQISAKPADPVNKFLADWLLERTTGKNKEFFVNFKLVDYENNPSQGAANVNKNTGHIQVALDINNISVTRGALDLESTIIHEMIHAVTKAAIFKGEKETGTPEERKAYRNLKKLYDKYKATFQTGPQGQDLYTDLEKTTKNADRTKFLSLIYPGKNMAEFVVGIMTQPALRQRLNELEYNEETGQTFWEKIVQIFTELLNAMGIDMNSTSGKAVRDIIFLSEKGNIDNGPGMQVPMTYEELGKAVTGKPVKRKKERTFEREHTPDNPAEMNILMEQDPEAVFVFGSNPLGINGNPVKGTGGAALSALQGGWVEQGEIMDNRMSKSQRAFGITTVTGPGKKKSKTLAQIREGVIQMIKAAKSLPDKKFYVTKIGTQNAGYTVKEISSIFEKLADQIPDNVVLPIQFEYRADPGMTSASNYEFYEQYAQYMADQENAKAEKVTPAPKVVTPPIITGTDSPFTSKMTPEQEKFFEGLDDETSSLPSEALSQLPAFLGDLVKTKTRTKKNKFRIITASPLVARILGERKSAIDQLYKRDKDLRADLKKKGLSDEEALRLNQRRQKVYEKIQALRAEMKEISSISTVEKLIPIGEADLQYIEDQLLIPENLDIRDIHILSQKLKLWENYKENFLLTEEEQLSPVVIDLFKDIIVKVQKLEGRLLNIKKQMIQNLGQSLTNREISSENFWKAAKDIGWAGGYTLSLDNANQILPQLMLEQIKHAEWYATEELNKIVGEIQELLDKVKGKEAITGKNFSNFFEVDEDNVKTFGLISMYSPKYMRRKNSLLRAIADYQEMNDGAKEKSARKSLHKLVRENEVVFDIRKLVQLSGFEDHYSKDDGKLKAELISILGKPTYEERLEKAIKKYQEYQSHLKGVKDKAAADFPGSPQQQEDAVKNWKVLNDLFAYFDYRQDPKVNNQTPLSAWKFAVSVPKLKNKEGESLYNEKYMLLQQDEDVAALHRYTIHLLSKLKSYLPSNLQAQFNFNSLPALQKTNWEMLTSEGMGMAFISLMDKMKMSITDPDASELLFGADESGRNLNMKMSTLKTKLDKLVQQKIDDYTRKNDKKPTEELKKQFKAEAATEVEQAYSLNLLNLLGTYAGTLVNFHHKTRIEDSLRIMEELFKVAVKEPATNAEGETQERVYFGGVKLPEFKQNPHVNHINMIKSALDRFWQIPKEVDLQSKSKMYTKKEQKRKESLEEELKDYEGQIKTLKAKLDGLNANMEGLSPAQILEKSKETAEIQDEIQEMTNKLEAVNVQLKQLGQNISGSGMVNTLIQYIVVKGLGWNIFGGVTNLGVGTMSNLIEAAGGRWFNEDELMRAYRIAMQSSLKSVSFGQLATDNAVKTATLMKQWDTLKTVTREHFRTPSAAENALDVVHWAQVYKTTEFINQAPVMIAMMLHYKLQDLKGNESNLWEAYGKNGKWDTERFGDMEAIFDINARAKFKSKMDKALRHIHGNYDKAATIAAKDSSLGRLLTVFRNWMFEGFKNRFEAESQDEIDNFKRKGRYRSYAGSSLALGMAGLGTTFLPLIGTALGGAVGLYLGNKMRDSSRFKEEFKDMSAFEELEWTTKYLIRKMTFGAVFGKVNLEERFTETDAMNLRKNMSELSLLLFVTGLMMVLRHLVDGEDDEDKKSLLTYNLNVLHRLQQDLGAYSNPISLQSIMRDPIPATGVVTDSMKFIREFSEYIQDPESDKIPTGRYAGQSSLERATSKLVPGWRVKTVTENLAEQELPNF